MVFFHGTTKPVTIKGRMDGVQIQENHRGRTCETLCQGNGEDSDYFYKRGCKSFILQKRKHLCIILRHILIVGTIDFHHLDHDGH